MSRLIDSFQAELGAPGSAIGFTTARAGDRRVWDRYLTLNGAPAYRIGNVCNTCEFFFERLEGASGSVGAPGVAQALEDGLAALDPAAARGWGRILPPGRYVACLLEARPALVAPGAADDYFSGEQVEGWGLDGFWGMPHSPRTEYYRLGVEAMETRDRLFEFLVPMFPRGWLDAEALARYGALLERGGRPTALAVSVLDVKGPAMVGSAVREHWCLAHYLLDGHHKTYAAARAGRPLTLLSFLAVDQGVSSPEQALRAVETLGR